MHLRSALCALLFVAGIARAGDAAPMRASDGLALARDAAKSWTDDAALVYVENDEAVNATGQAARWGYLFYSKSLDRWRGYSLERGEIVVASDLGFALDAPPLQEGWIDSDRAFHAAEDAAGRDYREKRGATLRSMLLIRGAFHDQEPDRSTWTLVYDAADSPSLFVVVDAKSGDVVRTWKG